MAAKFGFLKIGEANAAIEKLTTERDDFKARAEAAEQNATDLAEQAEKARKESGDGQSVQKLLDDEKAAHAVTKQQLEKANAELKAAKDEVAALPAKIESEGSKKAQQIMASLGQPPLQTKLSENPAAPAKVELSGLEKTKAAFIANLKSQKA